MGKIPLTHTLLNILYIVGGIERVGVYNERVSVCQDDELKFRAVDICIES